MKMEARDDYWQKDESLLVNYQFRNVKTVNFYVIPESAQRSIALETGKVDIVSGMSADAAARFEGNADYAMYTNLDNNTRAFTFNCNENSRVSDVRLRQAILYAFDSQGILDGALDGKGEVVYAYGSYMYPDVYPAWDDGDYYAYNLEKAKQLAKESGYDGKTPIRLLTTTNELNGKIANILMGYLEQAGIKLEILQYEETLMKTYMRDFTSFEIMLDYGGAPDAMVIGWNSSLSNTIYENKLNFCGINDEHLQELLVTALNEKTHDEKHMTQLYDYMNDNALIYGLFSPNLYTVSNNKITKASLNHDNWMIPGCNTYVWN
jgi:ABC-type transport system substrate-binding protein